MNETKLVSLSTGVFSELTQLKAFNGSCKTIKLLCTGRRLGTYFHIFVPLFSVQAGQNFLSSRVDFPPVWDGFPYVGT